LLLPLPSSASIKLANLGSPEKMAVKTERHQQVSGNPYKYIHTAFKAKESVTSQKAFGLYTLDSHCYP